MAKYKPGQFVKVQNKKGLYRVEKGFCENCALCPNDCIYDCVSNIGWYNMIVKVK